MRKSILIKTALFSLMIVLLSGCHSKKNAASRKKNMSKGTIENNNVINTFEVSNLNYFTFSGKAKAKVSLNKASHDVTANIRIQKDKAIWISVTALLGIEVARVLITPDSVKILNKLQSTYISKPFSYIYNYTSEGVTFDILQDLLVGNISSNLLRTENVQVASSEDDVQIIGIKDDLTFNYGLNESHRPYLFKLTENGVNQNMEATYRNYTTVNGHGFPQVFSLQAQGDNIEVKANLEYSKLEFNENVEIPFAVPSRYKVIN
ncbi:DUF4292 domain-containing protein [Sphingobacterium hungaricum]